MCEDRLFKKQSWFKVHGERRVMQGNIFFLFCHFEMGSINGAYRESGPFKATDVTLLM